MQTLNLEQAAEFLRCTPGSLRKKASRGEVPGRKVGRGWIFVREHLAEWISTPEKTKNTPVRVRGRKEKWDSTDEKAPITGGYNSPTQLEDAYSKALALPTSKPPKNSTTGSKPNRGAKSI